PTLAVNSPNPVILQPSLHREDDEGEVEREHTLTLPLRRSVTPGAVSSIAAGTSLAVPSAGGYRGPTSDAQSSTFSPDNKRTDASAYYTAAWGSPYATPSSRSVSWQLRSRQGDFESELDLENSPFSIRTTARGEEQLLPDSASQTGIVPFPELTSTLFERDLQPESSVSRHRGKSIKDFTQDWINQYLTGKPRSERTNWLSDDSGDSDVGSFLTAYQQRVDGSEGWLDLDGDDDDDDSANNNNNNYKEDILKTPTASSLFKGKRPELGWKSRPAHLRAKHAPKASTATLKQSDFWDFGQDPEPSSRSRSRSQSRSQSQSRSHSLARSQSQSEACDQDCASVTMSSLEPLTIPEVHPPPQQHTYVSPTDKPLPLPPTPVEDALDKPLPSGPKETIRTAPAFLRPKKKVAWRGKQCIIALPLEDSRGSAEGGKRLLTPADVEQILDSWEEKGYDVRGTGRGEPVTVDLQNRQTHPDPADTRRELEEKQFHVSFPDQSVWEEYVDFLKEEKLRALGVSLGDPEPNPIMSPTPGAMSRNSSQMPMLPGHTISPPIPTSSAGSNHLNMMQNPFSPAFNQSTKATSNISSMNSPASPFGFHPESPFQQFQPVYGNETNYPFLPFQPTPPAHGTHTPQNLYGIRPNGITPTNIGNMPNLGSLLHSVSPILDESKQYPGMASMLPHSHFHNPYGVSTPQARMNEYENTMHHQPMDEPTVEMEEEADTTLQSIHSGPEIAHPTPRGHRHNVSETLQKGVERDYQMENPVLEDEPRVEDNLMNSRWAAPEQPMGQQHAYFPSESISQSSRLQQHIFNEQQAHKSHIEEEASDLETNPSIKDVRSPGDDYHTHQAKQSTGSTFIPGHKSTSSISKLNVAAKAFDPSISSFSPTNFSFMSNNTFQPTFSSFHPQPAFNQDVPQSVSHSAHSSGFNVEAPAFAPIQKPQEPISTPSNFKFSSATFNVAAPVFNPGTSFTLPSSEQKPSPSGPRTKIFDNFDPAAIVPPTKASKAIPIVRPGDRTESNDQPDGDASGRFGAQGREKRARRVESHGGDHSDTTRELMFTMSPAAAADSKRTATLVEDSDEVPPEIAANRKRTEEEIIETILSAHDDDLEEVEEGEIVEDKDDIKQFEFKNKEDAAAFNAAHPSILADKKIVDDQENLESQPAQPEVGADKEAAVDQEEQDTIVEGDDQEEHESPAENVADQPKTSVLKPTAKPFEFISSKPPVLKPISPVASPLQTPISKPKKQGLYASRYAVSEPDSPEPVKNESALTASLKAAEQAEEVEKDEKPTAQGVNSSDEDEIDAVMQQLNDGDSSVGVERRESPSKPVFQASSANNSASNLAQSQVSRSDAPSPCLLDEPPFEQESPEVPTYERTQPPSAPLVQRKAVVGGPPSIRQLNTQPQDHISDWDDAILSGDDLELRQRAPFFETHVKDIVRASMGDHLAPIERSLSAIQLSISQNPSYKPRSARVEHSDADDEDDEDDGDHRPRSPRNKHDKLAVRIKAIVSEALATHRPTPVPEPAPKVDLSEVTSTLAEMKAAIALVSQQQSQTDGIREIISQSISDHPALKAKEVVVEEKPDLAPEMEKLKLQVEGLQSMLRLADERAESEYNARRAAQDALALAQQRSEAAEKGIMAEREAKAAAEEALELVKSQHLSQTQKVEQHSRDLQEQQEMMRLTLSELSNKNIDLQGTLDEYRTSADQARAEKERFEEENNDLLRTIEILKIQTDEGADVKQKLRERFEKLQGDMTSLIKNIAHEQAEWRKKEVEANIKYNTLKADFDREHKQRQKLELHISDLEQKEMEATKLRFILDQSQNENDKLEALLMKVRQESHDHQARAAQFEREAKAAIENSHFEAERVRALLETDLNAAHHQVNFVRTELEAQISNVQSLLDNAKMDSETAKARYELLLAEARDSKLAALHDAAESKEVAIQDQRRLHERTLNDLRERHARAMHNTSEDRQRDEAHYMEVVALRDERIEHLQERVASLEEKLEIAKSAARAAAEAAQTAKAAPAPQQAVQMTSPSMTYAQGSEVPDKISPQALRESIMVLQDQLQQREGRIEELEQELSTIDRDAPAKIKEKETEINWLRELLSVRLDDLRDLIRAVSQPSFDQHTVRDAAIRLRANLQMQQQEKERAMSGGNSQFPSIASLTSLASSPRALPLAAAAAWGNWRKGNGSSSSNSNNNNTSVPTASSSNSSHSDDQLTPSKPPKPALTASQGFLSGLMTPPSSNTRDPPVVPPAPIGRRTYAEARPLRGQNPGIRRLSSRQLENIMPPTTPPLLRNSSYDHDAETMHYGASSSTDDNDNDSVIGGLIGRETGTRSIEGPFGPEI
ncbi:hypothetical protein H101_06646, partial [Trichophyton interdigitale H6]